MTQEIEEAVKKVLSESKPRNFTQSIDVVMTINDLDINKPENRLDEEVLLPNGRGKDVQIYMDKIEALKKSIYKSKSINELMGYEGNIRKIYYMVV